MRDEPASVRRSVTYPYFVVGILTLVYVFNFMDRQIVAVLAEPIRAELDLTDTQLGLLSGPAFAIFYTAFGVPVAWLADRFNRVRIVALACAMWSAFTMASGYAANFTELLLARIGVGVGEAGGSPPSHSVIADYFPPEKRGLAFGLFGLGVAVGPNLGSAIGGSIASEFGWRAAFLAIGAPGLALALLTWLLVKEPIRGRLDIKAATPSEQPRLSIGVSMFFADRLLRWTALGCGFAAFAGYSMAAWTPAMLMREKAMTLAQFAFYNGLPGAAVSLVGTLLSGWLCTFLGERAARSYALIPAIAMMLSAPLALATIWAPDWPSSFAFYLAFGFLANMFLAPSLAVVQNSVNAPRRAVSSSLLLFVLNFVGLGGGPLFVGAMSDWAGARFDNHALQIAMSALALVYVLAAFTYFACSLEIGRRGSLSIKESVR